MKQFVTISISPEHRLTLDGAISIYRKKLFSMGYIPDSTDGTYTREVLPLQERFKSDEVDLSAQEVSLLWDLLCEYSGYLQGRLDIPLVPDGYTSRVHKSLDSVNNLLEILR